ncbi:3D domain-containing protein [Bacillus velezensis]|uniref:3D domain-containing protein n=1 Tax=Bacillus velezensis TaxID=492670 RepID=UPI0022E5A63D|nr:3D domain-containing protein [Bacillus velezensis]
MIEREKFIINPFHQVRMEKILPTILLALKIHYQTLNSIAIYMDFILRFSFPGYKNKRFRERYKGSINIRRVQNPMKKLIAVSALGVSMLIASPTFAQEVKPGDTMSKIARENNMSLQELAEANPQIKNLSLIYPGQEINTKIEVKEHQSVVYEGYKHFTSTAYSMGTVTATGTKVQEGRTIAVDPNVIPLGSKVEIKFPEGYEHLNGVYKAEDTGSAIKGNKIDVYLNANDKCIEFGVRDIQVKILK